MLFALCACSRDLGVPAAAFLAIGGTGFGSPAAGHTGTLLTARASACPPALTEVPLAARAGRAIATDEGAQLSLQSPEPALDPRGDRVYLTCPSPSQSPCFSRSAKAP